MYAYRVIVVTIVLCSVVTCVQSIMMVYVGNTDAGIDRITISDSDSDEYWYHDGGGDDDDDADSLDYAWIDIDDMCSESHTCVHIMHWSGDGMDTGGSYSPDYGVTRDDPQLVYISEQLGVYMIDTGYYTRDYQNAVYDILKNLDTDAVHTVFMWLMGDTDNVIAGNPSPLPAITTNAYTACMWLLAHLENSETLGDIDTSTFIRDCNIMHARVVT